jgi:predicted nucleic acid-binding protein
MTHLFLDTSVVIDFLIDRKPNSQFAARLFDYSDRKMVKLYMAALSYNNIYYLLKKITSYKEAIRTLKILEELTETIDTNSKVIQQALHSDFKDFEDAIQYYSAFSNKRIQGIVTRNASDFKHSKLPVWAPEQAIHFVENQL